MGIFGWSYPPGCSGTPYDEAQASDITKFTTRKPDDVDHVFWDEDGILSESFHFTVPAEYEMVPCACLSSPPLYAGPNYEPCPICGGEGEVKAKNPLPAYTETDHRNVGECDWDDELTDEENFRRAGAAYDAIKECRQ